MIDRRENILAALLVIAEGFTGYHAFRNRSELAASMRPAILILEGTEETTATGNARGGLAPSMVTMRPEIVFQLDNRKPENKDAGQTLNGLRRAMLTAIASDPAIATAIGPNGVIRYEGAGTDMAEGKELSGRLTLLLAFVYPLIPAEL